MVKVDQTGLNVGAMEHGGHQECIRQVHMTEPGPPGSR